MDIEFLAYATDCRVAGYVHLDGERLTDMLNAHPTITVHDALLESLADGHQVWERSIELARDEVFAIEGAGPRGKEGRRIRTRPHRLQIAHGPYLVLGYLHAFPGADPLASLLRRDPMLPLTDATIVTTAGGRVDARDTATIIVNRELAEWIRPSQDEWMAFPDVPILQPTFGTLLPKDLTWHVPA